MVDRSCCKVRRRAVGKHLRRKYFVGTAVMHAAGLRRQEEGAKSNRLQSIVVGLCASYAE